MPNTGKKIILTLKQINSSTFLPTGLTEPNDPSSPDYLPPVNDPIDCPISNSLVCPVPIIVGYAGAIGFEFSLFNSVVDNPQISSVKVIAVSQSATKGSSSFSLPNNPTNYFSGSIGTLIPGSYSVNIQYFSGSTSLTTCSNTSSIAVS